MSVPVVAFFCSKVGEGQTSLVYHLAHMYAEIGLQVLAVDLDPQCNLTASFLDDDALGSLFDDDEPQTILHSLRPVLKGTGDLADPRPLMMNQRLWLIPGDMALSGFEDALSEVWPKCLSKDERAFRVTSSFWRAMQRGASETGAALIMVDLGPNLGAINRAALIATDSVVIPLGPDLFSLQGLRNLGPALRAWRADWADRLPRNPEPSLELPGGSMRPVGYVIVRHSIRLDRPVKAFDRWMAKFPGEYRKSVLDEDASNAPTLDHDPNCIAKLRDYRSLMPLSQEAHKPMFALRAADKALGAHATAAQQAYGEFNTLSRQIAARAGIALPGA